MLCGFSIGRHREDSKFLPRSRRFSCCVRVRSNSNQCLYPHRIVGNQERSTNIDLAEFDAHVLPAVSVTDDMLLQSFQSHGDITSSGKNSFTSNAMSLEPR